MSKSNTTTANPTTDNTDTDTAKSRAMRDFMAAQDAESRGAVRTTKAGNLAALKGSGATDANDYAAAERMLQSFRRATRSPRSVSSPRDCSSSSAASASSRRERSTSLPSRSLLN